MPNKRITATLLSTCLISLTILPAPADEHQRAFDLLRAASNTLHVVKSISADITVTHSTPLGGVETDKGKLECLKPNYLRGEWSPGDQSDASSSVDGHQLVISDGRTLWTSGVANPSVIRYEPATLTALMDAPSVTWSDFYKIDDDDLAMYRKATDVQIDTEEWDGDTYTVVSGTAAMKDPPGDAAFKIYIGKDGIVHRAIWDAGGFEEDWAATNLRTTPSLTPSDFKFDRPKYAIIIPAVSDPKAVRLLKQVDARARSIQALRVTVRRTSKQPGLLDANKESVSIDELSLQFLRPSYISVDSYNVQPGDVKSKYASFHSDGRYTWDTTYYDANTGTYVKQPVKKPAPVVEGWVDELASHLCESSWADCANGKGNSDDLYILTYFDGVQPWCGRDYKVVRIVTISDVMYPVRSSTLEIQRLYIGDDCLVHRLVETSRAADQKPTTEDSAIVAIDTHARLTKHDFSYRPAAGFTAEKPIKVPF